MNRETKYIGGFFEEEETGGSQIYHAGALALANGRSCLNMILSTRKPARLFLPFYICDSILPVVESNGIRITYYAVNEEFELNRVIELDEESMLLYVNYFGLKSEYSIALGRYYEHRLIVDDTQNFFQRGYDIGYSFNSCRKFFGVPDGGYLYGLPDFKQDLPRNTGYITDHLSLRRAGRQEEAYAAFKRNENLQCGELRRISEYSDSVLQHINYEEAMKRRRENFRFYSRNLDGANEIRLEIEGEPSVPFAYPYLPAHKADKERLREEGIYIPTLWPEVVGRKGEGFDWEKRLSTGLMPLPVDHRYSERELQRVVDLLN